MSAKWTPWPWRIAENEYNAKPHDPWTDAIKIEGDVNVPWSVPPLVCALYRGGERDANANLIATAPEMALALKHIEALTHAPADLAARPATTMGTIRAIARTVLARANGETP